MHYSNSDKRMKINSIKRILFVALILGCLSIATVAEPGNLGEETIIFGVAPFMSPLALVKRMTPLREYLSEILERPVIIETASHARVFLQRSINGRYDYILTSPSFALKTYDSGKYLLLVTQKNKISGQIVVLNKSEIMSINDLAGKTIGSPPKVGFLGQMIGPFFNEIGLINEKSVEIIYFHSHNDSILALIDKTVDAVVVAGFMEKQLIGKDIKIREIVRTEEYPGLTMLSSNRRPADEIERVKQAMLVLTDTEKGKRLLGGIALPPFVEVGVSDLEVVRRYADEK